MQEISDPKVQPVEARNGYCQSCGARRRLYLVTMAPDRERILCGPCYEIETNQLCLFDTNEYRSTRGRQP
jgi:ribosomal protein S27AE